MKNPTFLLLKLSVFFIFIGRAWQHLFWDAPYRTFFWDESLLKPIVEGLSSMSWQEYATSATTDTFIQNIVLANGLIYLFAAIAAIRLTMQPKKWQKAIIVLGGISLVFLTVLLTKEKFYHAAQFFEHSIQFGLPFVLLFRFSQRYDQKHFILILKILIALTFFSHGLYAFGFYPVPGNFVDMVIQIFDCSEQSAITFLYIAGVLDFILAILIFIPKAALGALTYAILWGLLTAFARIVANFNWEYPLDSFHQYFYQVVYRLAHGFVPLLVLLYIFKFEDRSKFIKVKKVP
ncbi:DoxX-like family protein [Aquimarina brevivitae]|uniref:DoxX-like protein n=1 Tax=Aquimarina brevivitae TaxID=323412 RepID=A0A4Q7P0N9_9FLAO|nr:DoxX-like family protein [Aquimarina brevivitae]RZS93361.1 hypothetical protein EV197_1939 [Aquimarina brevivitae]